MKDPLEELLAAWKFLRGTEDNLLAEIEARSVMLVQVERGTVEDGQMLKDMGIKW